MEYLAIETQKKVPVFLSENELINLDKYLQDLDFDKIIVITDSNVIKLWKKKFSGFISNYNHDFFVIEAGEKSKNFKTYQNLCEQILDKFITKKSLIITLGGGVVGNIGGFVAATLFRGIKFIHIPTTIIAQADSTTGGKQAINSTHGKNTIGTFYEPEFILIDYNFLDTLPKREINCGIAECIKHALCQNTKLLSKLLKVDYDKKYLREIINETIKLKLLIIKKDRTEINEGKILVYGHTLGHAIETLANNKLNHGEAISIGMCCVAKISNKLGYLSKEDEKIHSKILNEWNLPTKIPKNISIDKIIHQLKYDKKITDAKIELILLKKIGTILKNSNRVGTSIEEEKLRELLSECY